MTDLRERYADTEQEARTWLDDLQSRLWTSAPGIIQSVTTEKGVPYASVALAIKGKTIHDNLSVSWGNLPLLPHVPLYFPRGGGFSLTFPVAQGDECLVVFGARSIDEWFQNGGAQPALDHRMHDLSDGIALVGLTSSARPIPSSISTSSLQLRSDDGQTVIDLANGAISVTATTITLNGNVIVQGTVSASGNVTGADISLDSHTHAGVQTGSGITSKPA